jgi:hypothetical protein
MLEKSDLKEELKEDINNVKLLDKHYKQEVTSNCCLYMAYFFSALCFIFVN